MPEQTAAERAASAFTEMCRIWNTGATTSVIYAAKVGEFATDYALKQHHWATTALLNPAEADAHRALDHYDEFVRQMVALPIEFAHQYSVDAQGVVRKATQ